MQLRIFHAMGVRAALITLGKEGAVLSQDGHAWHAQPPQIDADIPTGAGAATLAGFVWGLSRGASPDEALRLGVASGTSLHQPAGNGSSQSED